MVYAMRPMPAKRRQTPADALSVTALMDARQGCTRLSQRLLGLGDGARALRAPSADDELLYVLQGAGRIEVAAAVLALSPGTGVYLPRATAWSVEATEPLELLSVLVHRAAPSGAVHVVADLLGEHREAATASRQFSLGVGPQTGCPSATQFIGFVPPGRAPDHYHHYDEVIYILAGGGVLHIGQEAAPIGAGSCVHLPARLVHCLENTGSAELVLLGVFTPGGSPAEAYYPDGTPAAYPSVD